MEQFLWVEKYRPHKIDDVIAPDALKVIFKKFIEQNNIPNLLLAGPPGTGKTTVARALCEEMKCDYIVINGSDEGRNIDTLRSTIQGFASSVSLYGGRKYVIIDEADYLNPTSFQPALRAFIETFSINCGFIMTCNYKDKLIQPLQSRFSLIDFKIDKQDMPTLASRFLKRLCDILSAEKIAYEKPVLAEFVKKHLPDWRRIIGEVQLYASGGTIDSGILASFTDKSLDEIARLMRDKNFTELRKAVGESDLDILDMYTSLYHKMDKYLKKQSVPNLVLILAKYQYQHAFVANPEINLVACLVEIMMECDFV